jgi:hypothetical protein
MRTQTPYINQCAVPLNMNTQTTIFIILSKDCRKNSEYKDSNKLSANVAKVQYLEMIDDEHQINFHIKIKRRLGLGNTCHCSVRNILYLEN